MSARIALSKNLFLDEYIPEHLYRKYEKTPWILQGLIDIRLVKSDQLLRDFFGALTINNWWAGGDRNWSGLRTKESPDYSETSQHSFGRASDKIFTVPAEEVRKYIRENNKVLGITCIEDNISWVHSDVRYYPGGFLVVSP